MAIGDIKTFDFVYNGLVLQINAIDLGGGKTTFEITCLTGYADINALYWNDGIADGSNFDLGTKKDNSLNMNGSGEDWDGGVKLSSTGLGPQGTAKPTYLTAGKSYSMEGVSVDWASLDTLGVRATSTSTAEGSIKGVDGDSVVTEAPTVCIDDLTVTEGVDGYANFTVTLDHAYLYDVTIAYSTSDNTANDGPDYTGSSGTVTIAAGDTSATISIEIIDDDDPEDTETFHVNLTGASADIPGTDVDVTIQCEVGIGTILDTDVVTPPGGGGEDQLDPATARSQGYWSNHDCDSRDLQTPLVDNLSATSSTSTSRRPHIVRGHSHRVDAAENRAWRPIGRPLFNGRWPSVTATQAEAKTVDIPIRAAANADLVREAAVLPSSIC